MITVTPKQYRVAAQHLKQAQESLRLAAHALGSDAGRQLDLECANISVRDAIADYTEKGVE